MKINRNTKLTSVLLMAALAFFNPNKSMSQDVQLTQFFEMPLYLNPAFAGSAHHYRGIFHQRMQWPALDAKYTTSIFSFDKFFNQYKSGVGLLVTQDWQGEGNINSTTVGLQYAYELHVTDALTFRPGLQLDYGSRLLNFSTLSFPDEYTDNGYQGGGAFGNNPNERIQYADVSSGLAMYTPRGFAGYAAHHMNRPNQSFMEGVARWPVKHSFIAGYKIPVIHKKYMAYLDTETDISITPTAHYKFQGKSDQMDVGIYANYDQFMTAIWYRGIPVKHFQKGLQNNESLALLVGWRYGSFAITYSYDFVLSRLTQARVDGAHELNITVIQHKKHKGVKPMKVMPCPNFYKPHHDKHHTENHSHEAHPHHPGGSSIHENTDKKHHVEHHAAGSKGTQKSYHSSKHKPVKHKKSKKPAHKHH